MNAELLRESFDLIAPRKDEFGEAFYERLFEEYPATRTFFANTDIKKQAQTLVATLALVVTGVEKGENLAPSLRNLGKRHETYGVRPGHYTIVGEVLIETFKDTLGPQWTPAFQDAWVQAYGVIVQMMIH